MAVTMLVLGGHKRAMTRRTTAPTEPMRKAAQQTLVRNRTLTTAVVRTATMVETPRALITLVAIPMVIDRKVQAEAHVNRRLAVHKVKGKENPMLVAQVVQSYSRLK